jgi:hypothetical protein
MNIWTIYNHGTGGSSLKGPEKNEIINLFGNNDPKRQYEGKIVTEGVGSIGDPDLLTLQYSKSAEGGLSVKPRQGHLVGALKGADRAWNKATGEGVEQNVENTVEFIRQLQLAGHTPEGINMIGWSRGAVTCTRIAYQLYQSTEKELREIPINIFAVDPVAGAGHSTEVDACTINPNVKNYFATLAAGEKRRFFKPIAGHRLIVKDTSSTRLWVAPMPGHHSNNAKCDNSSGYLIFNLAYRFLSNCGTELPAMKIYSLCNREAWGHYESIILEQGGIKKTSAWNQFKAGLVKYSRDDEIGAHDFGEDFFPNVHARLLMFMVYPIAYDAYFSPINSKIRNTVEWVRKFQMAVYSEQLQKGMDVAMRDFLTKLRPTDSGGVGIPANVLNMAHSLRLIDMN